MSGGDRAHIWGLFDLPGNVAELSNAYTEARGFELFSFNRQVVVTGIHIGDGDDLIDIQSEVDELIKEFLTPPNTTQTHPCLLYTSPSPRD